MLGDFVDRGLQSKEIIWRLMAGPSDPKWEWIVLQGNHEDIMLQANYNPNCLLWWLRCGGDNTLRSYGNFGFTYPLGIDADHIAWLQHLPVYVEDEKRIFVHAGVPHDKLVTETKRQTLQWLLHKGDIPESDAFDPLYEDKPNISGKHIVHGHHQSMDHPLVKEHRTNLDSFAWYSGKLAIGVFDNTQAMPIKLLQVEGEAANAYFSG